MRNICKPLLFLSLPGLLSACQEEKLDFYRDPMHGHDVWRLPIIAPYELITAVTKGSERWNFQHPGFNDTFSPDSLNVSGQYITFHDFAQASYGYCDLKRRRLVRLRGFEQFADTAKARHFSTRLYHAESTYSCWHDTGQLPWAAEILAAHGCNSLLPKQP